MNTTAIILDAIIVLIIAVNVILGIKKGFIKTAYSFLKFAVSAVCAFIFAKPVAAIIKATQFYKNTETDLKERFIDYIASENLDLSSAIAENKEKLDELLSKIGLSFEKFMGNVEESLAQSSTEAAGDLAEHIITPICSALATAVAFIAVFIVASIVLWLVMKILNLVASAPIISQFNSLLGGVAGVVVASLLVFVLIMLVSAATPFLESTGIVINDDIIAATYIYKWFAAINPLAVALAFFAM